MKKFLVVLCLIIMFIPGFVKAETKEPIDIYIFHGDGCPHCAEAFEFFESIEDDYGKYFTLHQYEVWHSASYHDLLVKVAEEMGTKSADVGVPYIVIGEKVFLGYSKSYNEKIISAIQLEYNKDVDKRINKVKPIIAEQENSLKTIFTGITAGTVLLVVGLGTNFLVRKGHSKKKEETN